jgi:hypothetical protein
VAPLPSVPHWDRRRLVGAGQKLKRLIDRVESTHQQPSVVDQVRPGLTFEPPAGGTSSICAEMINGG